MFCCGVNCTPLSAIFVVIVSFLPCRICHVESFYLQHRADVEGNTFCSAAGGLYQREQILYPFSLVDTFKTFVDVCVNVSPFIFLKSVADPFPTGDMNVHYCRVSCEKGPRIPYYVGPWRPRIAKLLIGCQGSSIIGSVCRVRQKLIDLQVSPERGSGT